jgi:UDP-glucose 4-epimerase
MEGMAMKDSFWQDRPAFVTGATGLLGGWLVRRLLGLGTDVICLVRDWVPQSEIVRAHLVDRVKVVRGDVRDQALLERTLGEYEIDTVFSPRCTDYCGHCQPKPHFNLRNEYSRRVDVAGGMPSEPNSPWYCDSLIR